MFLLRNRLGVLSILCISLTAFAENKALRQQAEALWAKAEDLSKLDPQKMTPYHEEATFTLHGLANGDLKGKYHKEFADENDWIEEFRAGDYQKISIHQNKELYKHENSEFTPHSIQLLSEALAGRSIQHFQNEIVKKIRTETIGGVNAICVYSEVPKSLVEKQVVCVSQPDGALLRQTFMQHTTFRSGYEPFDGKLVATHLEVEESGRKEVEAEISFREDPALMAASIRVPAGLTAEGCGETVPPKVESNPEPAVPDGYRRKGLDATVTLGIVVGIDGRVKNSVVTESAGSAFDHNAQEAVRSWRFKPALCDGVPKQVKVYVEVNFQVP